MKQMLEVERQNLCAANKKKWDVEERGQSIGPPTSAEDWWYAPVKNQVAGKSCDSTCESILDKHQGSGSVGKVPNLYDEPGKYMKKSYCNGNRLKAIDKCDRLKVAFDCLYGCIEVEGPDQPSYVGVESDKNFGYCLHNPKKKHGTCSGSHFSTARLCPCSYAKFTVHKGRQGESCNEVCHRENAICMEPLLRFLDDCSVMRSHFKCKNCEKMSGADLPAFVSNPQSSYKDACVVNVKNDRPKGKDADMDCSGKHKDTQRLCACALADPSPKKQNMLKSVGTGVKDGPQAVSCTNAER